MARFFVVREFLNDSDHALPWDKLT